MLLVFSVFNPKYSDSASDSASGGSGPMVAVMMSNQSYAAFLPGGNQARQNMLPRDTFEWTNGSGSTPSMRFPSPFRAKDQD